MLSGMVAHSAGPNMSFGSESPVVRCPQVNQFWVSIMIWSTIWGFNHDMVDQFLGFNRDMVDQFWVSIMIWIPCTTSTAGHQNLVQLLDDF